MQASTVAQVKRIRMKTCRLLRIKWKESKLEATVQEEEKLPDKVKTATEAPRRAIGQPRDALLRVQKQ